MSWGLLSTARINDAILAAAPEMVVTVASRSAERAEAYAREKGIARWHGSYEALLADPEVDAVYVSLPNGMHVDWSIRALEAGKHVLVEKPFDRRAAEVERAFDVAESRGLVLSEAYMWRHHPQTRKLVDLLERVAPVKLVRATFSFPLDAPGDVRWDPGLDGGSLMDVGCYCVSGIRLVLGEPSEVRGLGVGDGVDRNFAGVMRFESGALATFDCGFDLPERESLEVVGDGGTIVLDDPWHARKPCIVVNGKRVNVKRANSYRLELEDVSRAIEDGRPPLLGREDAVAQARVIEALLA
ncbi:MAG TPA: Gfo/Idh/MocA family oxidoreductase [Solirubrobacteraceae bacterium]|nr:Gfo/Idh/MocA family oxidoreductase [Solirubrobacteraceae bacterium]